MERDFAEMIERGRKTTERVGNIIVAQIDYECRENRKKPGDICLAFRGVSGGEAKFVVCPGTQEYSLPVDELLKNHRAGILVFNNDIDTLLGKETTEE